MKHGPTATCIIGGGPRAYGVLYIINKCKLHVLCASLIHVPKIFASSYILYSTLASNSAMAFGQSETFNSTRITDLKRHDQIPITSSPLHSGDAGIES